MLIIRNTIYTSMINTILAITPPNCFIIKVCKFIEDSSRQKVVFYESDKSFHSTFCKRMSWLTEFCFKTDIPHEQFVVLLPDRFSFGIPADDNTFHVIGKDVNRHNFPFGRENFPYNLDRVVYNAKFEEHLFKNKQKVLNNIEFKYIKEFPYTFGLEFETAGGYLPQHQLYELGLIPLRDGSITGIEFTTVVLQGNKGLNSESCPIRTTKLLTRGISYVLWVFSFKID